MEKLAEGFKGQKAIITPYNVRNLQTSNPITRQMFVTHIGYYPKAKYHFFERPKGANENIFIYCSEGNGWINYKNEEYKLSRNQAFIIPANEAHSYGAANNQPWSIYWIHFLGDNIHMFSQITGKIIQVEDTYKSRLGDRFLLFEEIFQNLEMGYSPENLEYISFCLMYFLASIKYMNQYDEIKNVKEADVIQKSILYMKDNLENKITLADIASHVGYSCSYLGSVFSQRTSYSLIEYYNQLKIQRACSYLQFSDLKIKEIAFRLGYFDPFHFSKSFRSEMEITPTEYRKKYRKVGD
ncbi:MAG TPA: AraC family transcriptional regulator [Bacteroidales bacterium]|nr:AraC family transcriptional regulator [Bacteroidales bacterium]